MLGSSTLRPRVRAWLIAPAVAAALLVATPADAQAAWAAVDAALGRAGAQNGEVRRFSFPRSDLSVELDGVRVQPALALGSWLVFRPVAGGHVEVVGDLVLTQAEVKPVLQRLTAGGLSITALHNHLLRSAPGTMYMHVHGHGEAAALARTLRTVLEATHTPLAPPSPAPAASTQLDQPSLERVLGRSGNVAAGGVLQFSFPRAHPIIENGRAVPPSMGVATVINLQAAGPLRVAATGDFVLTAEEVEPVTAELARRGVEVTALHNHMLAEAPRLFFMHFWAVGPVEVVARNLRAALDRTRIEASATKPR